MNILRRILNKILGIQPAKPDRNNEPPKLDTSRAKESLNQINDGFPRPVSVSMRVTEVKKPDPMAQAIERAKRDAKKTAVKGSVGSASSSQTRPTDPWLDPMNPLNPLSPLHSVYEEPVRNTHHHVDTTRISDTHHTSTPSHSSHSSYDHSSSHSSHDSGSYDHGSSHSSHD